MYYTRKKNSSTVLIVILIVIIVLLGVYIYYINNENSKNEIELKNNITSLKDQIKESKKKDESIKEDESLEYVQGESSALIHNNKDAYYFTSTFDQSKPMQSSKLDLNGGTIIDAKIIKNALRNDNRETLFIVLNSGVVKYGFLSSENKIEFIDFPILKGQKVKKINSITVDSSNKIVCNVILNDNTTKNVEGFI